MVKRICNFFPVLIAVLLYFGVMASVSTGQQVSSEEDLALMQRLRTQIESLPPDRRRVEGVKILLDNVGNFESERIQMRVHLSIAELYRQMGQTEESLIYFKKAGVSGRDPDGIGAVSRGLMIDTLEEQGDLVDVLQQALEYRDQPGISDVEYAELTYKAGLSLISSGDANAGIELGIEAARNRPCTASFEYLETLASDVMIRAPGDKSAYEKGMRWLGSSSGDFGQTERFLGNLAHCEESVGNVDASISILERMIKKYPKSPDTPLHLLRLAKLSMQTGDNERAGAYLLRVAEGDFSDDFKEMAKNALTLITSQGAVVVKENLSSGNSLGRVILLVINILLVFVLAIWYLVKRKGFFRGYSTK